MRSYVSRHAGNIPNKLMKETNPQKIQNDMLKVNKSDRENWGPNGVKTAGFWSRWLTWSYPNLKEATKHIQNNVLKNKYVLKLDVPSRR